MKNSLFVLAFLSILAASCNNYLLPANKSVSANGNHSSNVLNANKKLRVSVEVESLNLANQQEIKQIEIFKQKEREEREIIPAEFRKIDFKNFTYPSFHLEKNVKLKNGELEIEKDRWSGRFQAVEYVDFNADGEKDALVELAETSVGGSSYTSFDYFIYAIRDNQPRMLWKFRTGSESSCGHKSVFIENGKIILEVFGICSADTMSSENYSSDTRADNYTRFKFGWSGRNFILEHKEVFPFPEKDVYKYLYKHTLEDFILNKS